MRVDMFQQAPVAGHMPAMVKRQVRSGSRVERVSGRMVSASGEINADDKKDLAFKINAIYDAMSSGQIQSLNVDDDLWAQDQERAISARLERHNDLIAAFHDQSSDGMAVMGEVFSEDLWETFNREGFTSQLVARKDVPDNSDNRVKIRRKDVTAFQLMNAGETIEQVIEQPFAYPDDYHLTARVTIEDRELAVAGPELLDEKFQDGLEAIMVRQDRILRSMFLSTEGVFNLPIAFATFTPQVLSALRTQVASNGIPAAHMLFSFDLWDDMISDPLFTAWWDPVHKYSLIMEGKIGSVLQMKLITDGFRYPSLRVLEAGEVFVCGSPVAVGQRGVRKEVAATEINMYNLGIPVRGWFFEGIESLVVLDRGIAIGRRI